MRSASSVGLLAAPFQPTDLPGLKGWWRAGDIAGSDADPVGTWSDLSSQANHLVQATGASKPLLKKAVLNGRDIVRFDGVNDFVATPAFTGGDLTVTTLILVGKMGTVAASRSFTDGIDVTKRQILRTGSGGGAWFIYAGTDVADTPTDTSVHIFAMILNGASSKLYIGGGAAFMSGNAGVNALAGLTLGSFYDGSLAGDCDLAEVLLYSGAHTPAQLDQNCNPLASAYNLAWSAAA